MKTIHRKRRGFTLIELLVVIAIIATLAGIGVPMIISQQKKGARTEATANAKQIGLAMFAFDQDYGTFPGPATIQSINDSNPDHGLTLGNTSSNDYFRQLIAAGIITSEKNFYAKGTYTKKPDNALDGTEALAAGEVGFAYIMQAADEPLSSAVNSGRPLIASSVYNALADGTFDPEVYDKKAIVLRIDNSVATESVRPNDKKCAIGGGKTLLDSGDGTVWDNTPIIVPPLKASGAATP